MKRQFMDLDGVVYDVSAQAGDTWRLRAVEPTEAGAEPRVLTAKVRRSPEGTLLVEQGGVSRPVQVTRVGDAVWISAAGKTTRWRRHETRRGAKAESGDGVRAPMTGKIVVVNVAVGDAVRAGDVLVVVEAMKMEQPLAAPRDGVVAKVACETGQLVDGGVELVSLVAMEESS